MGAAASFAPRNAQVTRLQDVMTMSAQAFGRPSFGPRSCYRILDDTASWLRTIPQRFSLETDTTLGHNVVRAVTPEGRIDSLVAGSMWRPVSETMVNVRFAAGQDSGVTLLLGASNPKARAIVHARTVDLSVQRIDCHR